MYVNVVLNIIRMTQLKEKCFFQAHKLNSSRPRVGGVEVSERDMHTVYSSWESQDYEWIMCVHGLRSVALTCIKTTVSRDYSKWTEMWKNKFYLSLVSSQPANSTRADLEYVASEIRWSSRDETQGSRSSRS